MYINKSINENSFMVNKWINRIKNHDDSNIELEIFTFINNLLTSKLEQDNFIDELAISLNNLNPQNRLASNLYCNFHLYRETEKSFSETMKKIYQIKNESKIIADDVFEIILNNKDILDQQVNHQNDLNYGYFTLKALEHHLIKIDEKILERPQHMLMRVAIGIHKKDIAAAIETYKLLSENWFIFESEILNNSGTNQPILSSSFLLTIKDDSLHGIYDTLKEIAIIMKKTNNIGLNVHKIRADQSYISGTNGFSNGLVSMIKVFNESSNYLSKNNNQSPALTIYLEPWHSDIFEFLDLKKETGEANLRARELFYALWIPDLFMQRVKDDSDWSLMCPHQCLGLDEVWGEEFEKLYVQYENEGKFKKQIKARELWNAIINSQIETGMPYMCYKDHCNRKSNQKNLGTIKCSNLGTEIIQYSSSDEIATCCSASIALHKFIEKDFKFNFEKLKEITKIVAKNLNRIIDVTVYPLPESKKSNLSHRPICISVDGLADVYILMHCSFDSEVARKLNIQIFETIYYGALEASCELAKEEGTYETYDGCPASKGILQYDMWNVNPTDLWNWQELKLNIKKYGLRNSLLVSLLNTKYSSKILNCMNNCEPYSSYFTNYNNSIIINHHLLNNLINLNILDDLIIKQLIENNGSIENIDSIPDDLKQIFKTSWNIKQKDLINIILDRAPFIDHSQSINVKLMQNIPEKLTSLHFFCWEKGLKTGLHQLNFKQS